jgi:hypothetical protein
MEDRTVAHRKIISAGLEAIVFHLKEVYVLPEPASLGRITMSGLLTLRI